MLREKDALVVGGWKSIENPNELEEDMTPVYFSCTNAPEKFGRIVRLSAILRKKRNFALSIRTMKMPRG